MSYLDELNEAQRKAVTHTEGPVMVLAGAGSGKTRVLTYRIVYLTESGVDPFNILSLTFTNKAAREMKARISKIAGESMAKSLWMGTFHSVFAKILRYEADKIGFPSNFTIYDSDDSKSLIRTIIKELNLDDKVYKPNQVQNRISSAKNSLISSDQYQNDTIIYNEDLQAKKPLLGKIYGIYTKRCFRSGAMDFDDLLYITNILLRNHADVLLKYQDKFRYVMVDEFQDTNYAQSSILKMLAARHENICVVGDDAQSIYAFRGANIQNILNFKNQYPDVAVYKLEQNYRSTKNIVLAANQVISKNKEQLQKNVWTSNDQGEQIKLVKCLSETEEGSFVANEILDLKTKEGINEDQFAILYRTNAQSRALEEALRKRNIPYRIFGGTSFYQRKEIKDLLAYYRMSINPHDEEAFKRVINYPARGIGQTSIDRIFNAASEEGKSQWDIIANLESANLNINTGIQNRIREFVDMIRTFQIKAAQDDAFETGNHIASATGILKLFYSDKSPESISRYENVQELLAGMKEFSEIPLEEDENPDDNPRGISAFIQDIALLTDTDLKDQKEDDQPKVALMTVHAAKGLEFPYVFIGGLEENLFPSQLSINSRKDLEEERRLFYVALTRAEKRAYLSFATTRFRFGSMVYSEPSRFLSEIEESLLELPTRMSGEQRKTNVAYKLSRQAIPRKLVKPSSSAGSTVGAAMDQIKIGTHVTHDRFGRGEVVGLEGEIPNRKATVDFKGIGKKQLLLKFAKLQIVESN